LRGRRSPAQTSASHVGRGRTRPRPLLGRRRGAPPPRREQRRRCAREQRHRARSSAESRLRRLRAAEERGEEDEERRAEDGRERRMARSCSPSRRGVQGAGLSHMQMSPPRTPWSSARPEDQSLAERSDPESNVGVCSRWLWAACAAEVCCGRLVCARASGPMIQL